MKKFLVVTLYVIGGIIVLNIVLSIVSPILFFVESILQTIAKIIEFAFYAFIIILLGYGVILGISSALKHLKKKFF